MGPVISVFAYTTLDHLVVQPALRIYGANGEPSGWYRPAAVGLACEPYLLDSDALEMLGEVLFDLGGALRSAEQAFRDRFTAEDRAAAGARAAMLVEEQRLQRDR